MTRLDPQPLTYNAHSRILDNLGTGDAANGSALWLCVPSERILTCRMTKQNYACFTRSVQMMLGSTLSQNILNKFYRALLSVLRNDGGLSDLKIEQASSPYSPGCE